MMQCIVEWVTEFQISCLKRNSYKFGTDDKEADSRIITIERCYNGDSCC